MVGIRKLCFIYILKHIFTFMHTKQPNNPNNQIKGGKREEKLCIKNKDRCEKLNAGLVTVHSVELNKC